MLSAPDDTRIGRVLDTADGYAELLRDSTVTEIGQ